MLIAKPEHTRNDLLKLATQQVNEFCGLNKLKPPKIRIITCSNYGFFQPNEQGGYIGINLPVTRLPVFKPTTGRAQSFPGNKSDRTAAGVLAHELGHYIDIGLKFNLAIKFRALIGAENSVTSYDTIEVERVAEAVRLFLLNPKLLEQGRPKAYGILCACLQPIGKLPWREVFANVKDKAKYIDWCKKWIAKKEVITREAKVMRMLIDKYPNAAPRYIVGA